MFIQHRSNKKNLGHFIVYFFLINILLSLLIGLNYLNTFHSLFSLVKGGFSIDFFLGLFLGISFIAQITIIFSFFAVILLVINHFIPKRILIFILAILINSLLTLALIADSIIFNLFRMHYALLAWEIFSIPLLTQLISPSLIELLEFFSVISVFILAETLIAWLTWRTLLKRKQHFWCYRLSLVFIFCIVASYGFSFMAKSPEPFALNSQMTYLINKTTRILPYYDEIYRLTMPGKNAFKRVATVSGEVNLQMREVNRTLDYPKAVLTFENDKQPFNILVISIDTWRHDAMNKIITPNIYQFAQQSLQFTQHHSGGNCTKSGIFSLFYGLPANYWTAFLTQEKGPVLIQQLLKENYRMGIFASAPLNFPAFDRTVFRDVKSLNMTTPGHTSAERDQAITQAFKKFIVEGDPKQPFFSFLFYDAVHNYCENSAIPESPFHPALKACNRFALNKDMDPSLYVNRYKNTVHFVDQEVKQVLDTLKAKDLLENTIVIITSDHGEEINDNHSGYWMHTTAYNHYQLHVPMIVYWPGIKPQTYSHLTTHYDIVPTLMTKVLHCSNPLSTYTVGQSLFTVGHRPYFIAGSYSDYAIISKDQTLRIYPGGDYVLDDRSGHPLGNWPLQQAPLQEAYQTLNLYFKKDSPSLQ